jgi:hypothetical protein
MKRPEQQIHIAIAEHLRVRPAPGLWWMHPPLGGFRTKTEAGIFKAMGVRPGTPDLILLREGKLYALELKAKGGRLSKAQLSCHAVLRHAGAVCAVATGIDEALVILESWQLLRGRASS